MKNIARRDFLRRSLQFCAAASAVTSLTSADGIWAQTPAGGVRRPDRYDEGLLILDRKPFSWPGGKTLAVWFIPNVEVFSFSASGGSASGADMDVLSYSIRDYGMRIGLWRLADAMDEVGARATVALNAGVCDAFPKAVEEMKKRRWEMMGHGITNSQYLTGMNLEQERAVIQTTLQIIEKAFGKKVRGWLGPGLRENFTTLDTLAEAGVDYTGDWNNDDLPYRMKVKGGEMYALPYGNQINDNPFFGRGHAGDEYYQLLVDQFDTLYADSKKLARIMGVPLHPYLTGQPLNIKAFQKALQYIKQRDRVWFATGSEILDAYKKVES
jgi:peptidoglycan/xylan/chitin deacetylase (PgdA/CDA1 family)